tara:strand:+ start:781 stop:1257 length:477 start_codon:yes stop_codon:yes gene_type:complete
MNFIPENPNTYQGNQVIINSDRLVFNAKQDAILLYSDKAMGFSTKGNFHFDTDNSENTKFIVNAPNIYLGIKNLNTGALPTQNAVLSQRLEAVLDDLCDFLESFLTDTCFNISHLVTTHGAPTGMNPTNFGILNDRIADLTEIRKNLSSIRSRNTKLV